jgi:hypothetical protein
MDDNTQRQQFGRVPRSNPTNGRGLLKSSLVIAVPALSILAGCQSIADVDLSAKDAACGQLCSTHHEECAGRITLMPIRQHNDCADAYKYCVQACPAKGTVTVVPGEKPSIAERLKELDALHKNGVITDDEYLTKKQELLKQL